MAKRFEIRLCENQNCGVRYPLVKGHPFGERCPVCLGTTKPVQIGSLSEETPNSTVETPLKIEALLDNIRSAWNVGAIFRTADGLGVAKLHLCGITPTPDHPSVAKTALGATTNLDWVYSRNALLTARQIIESGSHLWALEQDDRAVPIYSAFKWDGKPIALAVGNEVCGVDPELLDLCERIVFIPMLGKKRSLNVEVAFGIAVSALRATIPE